MATRVTGRRTVTERTKARVVINRAAMAEIDLALADGLFELGKAIVTEARVPDAPPYGEGLVERGGVIAYIGRKLVASYGGEGVKNPRRKPEPEPENYLHAALAEGTKGRRGRRPLQNVAKPRDARLDPRGGISVFAGYGFPGRFLEEGTAKMAAQPFLKPSLLAHIPDAGGFVKLAMEKRRILGAARRAAGDVYGGHPTAEGKAAVARVRRILRTVGP